MTSAEKSELKAVTMGCWWPSKYTGRTQPDWNGIRGELAALMDGAYTRGQMSGEMSEFQNFARLYDLAGTQIA